MDEKIIKYKEQDILSVGELLNMLTVQGIQNINIVSNIVHILNNTIIRNDNDTTE